MTSSARWPEKFSAQSEDASKAVAFSHRVQNVRSISDIFVGGEKLEGHTAVGNTVFDLTSQQRLESQTSPSRDKHVTAWPNGQ